MQIPGVDYTEKFNPVATYSSIRIVFELTLYWWDSKGWRNIGLVDVEAAFLEGKPDEPMYLKCPKLLAALGFLTWEQMEEYCIRLDGGMYRNVDTSNTSARPISLPRMPLQHRAPYFSSLCCPTSTESIQIQFLWMNLLPLD